MYPIAEISLLIMLASHIGVIGTLLYLIFSALLGVSMLKNQKLAALLTLGSIMRQRQGVSVYSLLWPLRYSLAGLLFILPGILSEVAGIVLLLPLKGPKFRSGAPAAPQDGVIEGEFHRVDPRADSSNRLD
jgi:UPF0716 protein FxsA